MLRFGVQFVQQGTEEFIGLFFITLSDASFYALQTCESVHVFISGLRDIWIICATSAQAEKTNIPHLSFSNRHDRNVAHYTLMISFAHSSCFD